MCDDSWDSRDASVVCEQLGCPTAITAIGRVNASEGSGPIWLDSISCEGHEPALWECKHQEWGKHYCNHKEDAGVTCSGKLEQKAGQRGMASVTSGNDYLIVGSSFIAGKGQAQPSYKGYLAPLSVLLVLFGTTP